VTAERVNEDVAGRLEEAAGLLAAHGTDHWRVRAYRRAAESVRRWPEPVDVTYRRDGIEGLTRIPDVGHSIARAIRELVTRGRLPMLDRLRDDADAIALLASVPGIGARFAARLHDELGLQTLEDLETAAHDGRLELIAGFGDKRLAGVRDSLAHRLARVRPSPTPHGRIPSVAELLDVDREYRDKAAAGQLPLIAPRRFNPSHEAWLPVLHTTRGSRAYTALFSNTERAHRAGRIGDWVVLYFQSDGSEGQHTVITAGRGPLRGQRVVAGREAECGAVAA
jgi:hypothetical protein